MLPRNKILQFATFNPLHRPYPLKLSTRKISKFYLLYFTFMITWPFCICCCETFGDGRECCYGVMLCVRSAIS